MSDFPELTRPPPDTSTHDPAHATIVPDCAHVTNPHDPAHDKIAAEAPAPCPADAPFVHLRKHRPVTVLLPRTKEWLGSVPAPVRPVALAARYPRIANLVCAAWENPPECRRYLNDLLIDRRGGRRGFPKPIVSEIQLLSEYYCRVYPYLKVATPTELALVP